MLKYLFVLSLALVTVVGCAEEEENPTGSGIEGDAHISVDHVIGLSGGKIPVDGTIIFYIRMTNNTGDGIKGLTHGLRIYSANGATWTTTVGDDTGVLDGDDFDLTWSSRERGVTGSVSDTVAISGAVAFNPIGMPDGFDDITHTITIGPVTSISRNRTICIDSCYFPPSGVWKWAAEEQRTYSPTWSGPHCYTVQ